MDNQQHRAMELLELIIKSQPGLMTPKEPYGVSGENAGEFINALYDQLLVLTKRNGTEL